MPIEAIQTTKICSSILSKSLYTIGHQKLHRVMVTICLAYAPSSMKEKVRNYERKLFFFYESLKTTC
jgi:hypothetical protein